MWYSIHINIHERRTYQIFLIAEICTINEETNHVRI